MWNGGGFGDYMSLEAHRGTRRKKKGVGKEIETRGGKATAMLSA